MGLETHLYWFHCVGAQQVWTTVNCESIGDYHIVYLYQDIFLLADIFEQFRGVYLKNYELDPVHYYTVPGLARDAVLKYTQVKLDTLCERRNMSPSSQK